jgi:hypothetical protein
MDAAPPGLPVSLKLLFIVGFPRSGTTWLRALLAGHPGVAALEAESYLFDELYLGHLDASWRSERAHAAGGGTPFALSAMLSEAEFDELLRSFASSVLARIARARPGASLVVEKTPTHARFAPLILRLFPDAYFLHIVRDPREVYCSTRAAARGWGRFWASEDAVDVTRRWELLLGIALGIANLTPRYRQLRYEDLLADTPGQLAGLLAWLGLDHAPELCRSLAEDSSLEKLRERWSHNPDFFRRGAAAGWRDELRRSEVALVEYIAGERMRALGYELSIAPRKPLRLRLRDVVAWLASGAARRLQALAEGPLGSGGRRPS